MRALVVCLLPRAGPGSTGSNSNGLLIQRIANIVTQLVVFFAKLFCYHCHCLALAACRSRMFGSVSDQRSSCRSVVSFGCSCSRRVRLLGSEACRRLAGRLREPAVVFSFCTDECLVHRPVVSGVLLASLVSFRVACWAAARLLQGPPALHATCTQIAERPPGGGKLCGVGCVALSRFIPFCALAL